MSNQDALEKDNSNSTIGYSDKEEDALVEKLKKLCDKNGKELKPTKSAAIFHQLAKVYQKRRPEPITHRMICLVKSAALFNAAVVRSDDSQDFENDLKDFCTQILHEAGAKQKDADLIKQANIVAAEIQKMRNKVEKTLNELSNIPNGISNEQQKNELEAEKIMEAELLLKGIARDYKHIMIGVAKFVENVIGEPPCEFSLAGMGSLAREEITPYSDFENMLILEPNHGGYEHLLNYFRWYSVIFQIILINLKETIIPSVFISSLNDKNSKHGDWFFDNITKRGICFDGMMPHACKFPLGRQQLTEAKSWPTELIKPVNEMLKYLNSEESLKNGYHLSTILTKTCHVYGNVKVYEKFAKGVRDLIEQEQKESIQISVKKQITDDLEKFATRQTVGSMNSRAQFNLKQVVYRTTTIFVSELGRFYKLPTNSCFEILRELAEKKHISENAKRKLLFAVALACEVRLKWYTLNKKQCDNVDSIETFVNLIGKEATVEYFRIAYALQCDISKRFNLKKFHLYSSPTLLNVRLLHSVKDYSQLQEILSADKDRNFINQRYFDFDKCLASIIKDDSLNYENQSQFKQQEQHNTTLDLLQSLGKFLANQNCYDDAIECYQTYLEMLRYKNFEFNQSAKEQLISITRYRKIANINRLYVRCLIESKRFIEAIEYLNQLLLISEKLSPEVDTDSDVANLFVSFGEYYTKIRHIDKAMLYLNKSLSIRTKLSTDFSTDRKVAQIFYELGLCFRNLSQNMEALQHLQKALKITEKTSNDVTIDRWIAVTLHTMGEAYIDLTKQEIESYNKAPQTVIGSNQIIEDSNTYNIDVMFSKKLEEAEICLKKALQIFEKKSCNAGQDPYVSSTIFAIGRCFLAMEKPEEAQEYFKKSLEIDDARTLDATIDLNAALSAFKVGQCLMNANKLEEAIICFEKALAIRTKISSDVTIDDDVAELVYKIVQCLLNSKKVEEARSYFEKYAQIVIKSAKTAVTNSKMTNLGLEIGRYLINENKPGEAQNYLNKSLLIFQTLSIDATSSSQVAENYFYLGRCLLDQDIPLDAIAYFENALQIYEKTSSDICCGNTMHSIGRCFYKMNQPETAKFYFERSLKMNMKAFTDASVNRDVADTCYFIGRCLYDMQKHKEAKKFFKKTLKIEKKLLKIGKLGNESIAETVHWISRCVE